MRPRHLLSRRERLYWNHDAVLSQVGLIDPSPPFADATEIAPFLRDKVVQ